MARSLVEGSTMQTKKTGEEIEGAFHRIATNTDNEPCHHQVEEELGDSWQRGFLVHLLQIGQQNHISHCLPTTS